ncbi:cell division protein ZapA [Desulfotalea psychrophila]|nr:cell division protein ZapA [Desulfotalea psychrophila]
MSDSERLVQFELLGQQFSFYTEESEEDMEHILSLVRDGIREDNDGPKGSLLVAKIAVRACLKMASDYVCLQRDSRQYREDSLRRISQLSEDIAGHLEK